jgi:hypothetical protein
MIMMMRRERKENCKKSRSERKWKMREDAV